MPTLGISNQKRKKLGEGNQFKVTIGSEIWLLYLEAISPCQLVYFYRSS
jgi:hypothetical protein